MSMAFRLGNQLIYRQCLILDPTTHLQVTDEMTDLLQTGMGMTMGAMIVRMSVKMGMLMVMRMSVIMGMLVVVRMLMIVGMLVIVGMFVVVGCSWS